MRSKVLRQRGISYVKSQQEFKKKRIAWGKYVYLLVLVVLGFSAINLVYQRAFYFKGVGYLESETKIIESPVNGRIVDIRCNINDRVSEGEPVVFLSNPRYTYSMNRNGGTNTDAYAGEAAKIIDVEGKVGVLKQEISQANEALYSMRADHQKARELLAIQAITRRDLSGVERQVRDLENSLKVLQIKYEATLKILDLYREQAAVYGLGLTGSEQHDRPNNGILNAPTDGVVSEIYKSRGEVAKVGEPIVKIVDPDHNFVTTYFTGEHENAIQVGDQASVHFANGEESSGVVRKIYPTALDQPKQLKNRFGSAQRYIIVEIVPEDGTAWQRILETEVTVRIRKKWFR
ncbi:HlyD family efflux transporter periplasmic adaptor subunit [bacterium]|nr:HlyD family efflux transporter periplasmic adaptor subunit [bacterium]